VSPRPSPCLFPTTQQSISRKSGPIKSALDRHQSGTGLQSQQRAQRSASQSAIQSFPEPLRDDFVSTLAGSSLTRIVHTQLMNDSVLDISKHAHVCGSLVALVLALSKTLTTSGEDTFLLIFGSGAAEDSGQLLTQLRQLSRHIDAYLSRLNKDYTKGGEQDMEDSGEEGEEKLERLSKLSREAVEVIERSEWECQLH
jgi:hypothetical protein